MEMPIDMAEMNNQIMKDCLSHYEYKVENFDSFDFGKAAACYQNVRYAKLTLPKLKQLEKFLDANPQYRFPGGVHGNISPCWGRDRRYHVEGGC